MFWVVLHGLKEFCLGEGLHFRNIPIWNYHVDIQRHVNLSKLSASRLH
jgi:hypothetical protein